MRGMGQKIAFIENEDRIQIETYGNMNQFQYDCSLFQIEWLCKEFATFLHRDSRRNNIWFKTLEGERKPTRNLTVFFEDLT